MPQFNPVIHQSVNSGAGPSGFWGRGSWSPGQPIDPSKGYGFFDDFLTFQDGTTTKAYGPYQVLDTGTGTIQGSSVAGGALFNRTTDNDVDQGIKLGDATSAPFYIADNYDDSALLGKMLIFECRVKKSVITNAYMGFFVGIAEASMLAAGFIAAGGADFADGGIFGFWNPESDDSVGSHVHVVAQKSTAAFDTVIDTVATLVADTWIKLGFVYDPKAPADKRITFYVDGVEQGTYVGENSGDATIYVGDTTNFPGDVYMTPYLVLNGGSTSDTDHYMDWWACWQER